MRAAAGPGCRKIALLVVALAVLFAPGKVAAQQRDDDRIVLAEPPGPVRDVTDEARGRYAVAQNATPQQGRDSKDAAGGIAAMTNPAGKMELSLYDDTGKLIGSTGKPSLAHRSGLWLQIGRNAWTRVNYVRPDGSRTIGADAFHVVSERFRSSLQSFLDGTADAQQWRFLTTLADPVHSLYAKQVNGVMVIKIKDETSQQTVAEIQLDAAEAREWLLALNTWTSKLQRPKAGAP